MIRKLCTSSNQSACQFAARDPSSSSIPFRSGSTSCVRWLLAAAIILVALTRLSPAAAADNPTIGINYNWYQLRADQIPECKEHSAWVLWNGGIVQQYNDPKIRASVRGQLAQMKRSGFVSMRIILHASHLPADHKEGLIHTVSGDISVQDQENIKNFVSDVATAGFRSLEVAFGFQQEGKLFCKINEWGDCFDPGRTDANWRFIDSSAALVKSSAQAMSLRFDLDNEGCVAPSMPPRTIVNAKKYLATIASRFREKYGDDEWLISCPDSQRAARLAAMLDGLKEFNLKPKFLEIHTYREEPDHVREVITAANDMAAQIDAKLILGELRYHSGIQEKIVHDFIHDQRNSRIVDILQWPLAASETKCPIDVQPPYDPGPYGQD
jgi:hypothetical protein